MLQNMHIKNIALIDSMDVEFDSGLNILTGETGAGKSIIIGSIGICLGGKFNKDILRNPDKEGLVELSFYIDRDHIAGALEALDIPFSDGEIVISRRLSPSGRTVNRINDVTVTTAKLKEVSQLLIDLHAQHEQQTLLKADKHLEILDRFGGEALASERDRVKKLYSEYNNIRKKLGESLADEAERSRRLDFLEYQINEIKEAGLSCGEDENLEAAYKRAVNAKDILSVLGEVYQITATDTNGSAGEQIGHSVMQLGKIVELDSGLKDTYDALDNIDGMLSDISRDISRYMDSFAYDEKELYETEQRLNLINTLKVKYGKTIEDILHTCETYEREYEELTNYEAYKAKLEKCLMEYDMRLAAASEKLSNIRKTTAKRLTSMLKSSLEELNFMTVEFDMHFAETDDYTANGKDIAYFMISTNIGEPVRPLYEVASGGELSRVMLALKSSLAYADDTPTLVFDEIDVGISGRTAQKVAEKLSIIAKEHQVICITHLPQIAAMADAHYIIEKNVENNKTISSIAKLTDEKAITEIARLIGGVEITENTLTSAKEMKGLAERTKIY